jgi:hypothetical protein
MVTRMWSSHRRYGRSTSSRSTARSATRALASGGPDRLVSEGQRRDLSRHREPQSAAPCVVAAGHDLGCDRRAGPAHQASDERRRLGRAGPPRRHGRDGGGPNALTPDLVRRRLFSGARPGRGLRAGAGLQRLDRRLLQGGTTPAFRRRNIAIAEHRLRARGIAAGRTHADVPPSLFGQCLSKTTI